MEIRDSKFHFGEIAPVITFYLLQLFVIIFYSFSSLFDEGLESELVITFILISITIIFALQNKRDFWKVLTFKNFRINILLQIIAIAVVGAIAVNFFAGWMNFVLFEEQFYYGNNYLETGYPFVLAVILVCVEPALFEEFAFRGFMFNIIEKSSGTKAAIIVTSFLFAILHLSILGLFWLLPIGLLFAYYRAKYNTIWYGVFGHFFYNLVIIIFEFLENPSYTLEF